MTVNEMVNSIDKANYETMKASIDTCYSIEKNKILGCISNYNRMIENCKMNISYAVAKPDFEVNVKGVFETIQGHLQSIKNLNEQLEILEKAYATIKID